MTKVQKLDDLLIKKEINLSVPEEDIVKNKESDPKLYIVRGKPKSGRVWKNEKKKFSTIIKTKGIRDTLDKKKAVKEQLKRVKEMSRTIIESKKEEVELKKQRRRDNIKRQEENRKKSEIVQIITNTAKLKRIRKKQLKYVEKRDTLNM